VTVIQREHRLYLLRITIEKGACFDQTFIGRPNQEEIIEAINLARMVTLEKAVDDDTTASRCPITKAKYDSFVTLVRDHWNADDTYRICVYASVTVATIQLKEGALAMETEAQCLTSDTSS